MKTLPKGVHAKNVENLIKQWKSKGRQINFALPKVPESFKKKPLRMHLIYNEKRHPDGSFDKDKARAVVGETKDVYTADQTSTYTPHQSSLHLNAAIADFSTI